MKSRLYALPQPLWGGRLFLMDPREVIIDWKFLHCIFSNNNILNIVPQVGTGKAIPSTRYLQHLEILGILKNSSVG